MRVCLPLLLVALVGASALPAWAQTPDRDADLKGMPAAVASEIRCKRDGDMKVPENRESALAKVPDSYVAWLRGGVHGAMASAGGLDLGWGAQVEGSIGLLNPLYLGGGLRWTSLSLLKDDSVSQFQADAVVGFTFRSYGRTWIKAGSSTSGAIVHTWSGNCQVRRTDYSLIGGVKYFYLGAPRPESGSTVTGSSHVTALQIGVQQVQRRSARSPQGGWSLAALYDPISAGYGLQGSFTGQGILLFFPGPRFIYTGITAGAMLSKNYASTPFWMTIDLGAAFEL